MAADPRIDAYIAKAAPFAQPILIHYRTLIHHTLSGLEETIKWGMPHFLYKGKNIAGMAAFKAHAALMIHGDGRQTGLAQDGAMGQFGKLTSIDDLPKDSEVSAKLLGAKARIDEAGTALKPRTAPRAPKAEIAMPADFAAELARLQGARERFDGFAPSHRREYLEWIVEAKRPETRANRIAQAAEWIAAGKKRNWKYENC